MSYDEADYLWDLFWDLKIKAEAEGNYSAADIYRETGKSAIAQKWAFYRKNNPKFSNWFKGGRP